MFLRHVERNKFSLIVAVPMTGPMEVAVRQLGFETAVVGIKEGYTADVIPKFVQLIIQNKIDKVYISSFCGGSRNVAIAAILTGRSYIWHIHETVTKRPPLRTFLFLRFAKKLIAGSKESAVDFQAYLPANKKIQVIYNAIDVPVESVTPASKLEARNQLLLKFGLPLDSYIIVTLGRVSYDKGHDLLLESAVQVTKVLPNIFFVVVGGVFPDDELFYQQLLSNLKNEGLDKKVVFAGFQDDIFELLRGSDLMVHFSRKEAFGLVLGEAMSQKTPVIAFKVGGMREIIEDGSTGYLIEPYEINQLNEKIVDLLNDEQQRKVIGEKARISILETFSIDNFIGQMTDLLTA